LRADAAEAALRVASKRFSTISRRLPFSSSTRCPIAVLQLSEFVRRVERLEDVTVGIDDVVSGAT
jgi:hypothetical protein